MISEIAVDDVIRHVERLAQSDGASALLHGHIELLSSLAVGGSVLRDADPQTIDVRSKLSSYSFCLTEEAKEALRSTPIFCANYDGFLAYSSIHAGEPYILISTGVLHAASYRLSLAIITNSLIEMFRGRAANPDEAQSVLGLEVAKARDLSIMLWSDLSKLPKLDHVFNPKHQQQFVDGILGCLIYIAMHEVGHIALGHVAGRGADNITRVLYTDEAMNRAKNKEFSADQFALESVRPEHRISFVTNMLIAFELYMDIERTLSQNNTHPLSINRIDSIANAIGAYGEEYYSERISAILESRNQDRLSRSYCTTTSFEEAKKSVDLLIALYTQNCVVP